ncbi:O-methyltransferase family 3 [Cordyceps fumosorosea ARSEF 2679]|uniref:O-methyltransferase family 3 n=1 Tax=Cordyceps fumosorosea (strain ARSEF 2679) TaxID=1081104 RepID=A0A167LBQ3_CORFA|nr:O-methyltransferase family 3 [Cordyceps fumosorosea ARSEF 2679]OAA52897.1 O-methyltransferase family 3 [Cordyceps fumosorosea ARSEF 2679]
MDSLSTGPVADVLARLYQEAEVADAPMRRAEGTADTDVAASVLASEAADLRGTYHDLADNFLCVSPRFGRHLYMCARAARARLVVEFGASMGVSTIFAAAALRDAGVPGGRVVTTELEGGKARRARENVAAAGLAGLVEVRVGDARETLKGGVDGEQVDVLLLDGAWSLYLEVLRLMEPHLRPGAVVLADNAEDPAYLEYVRDPRNGYLSLPLEFGEKEGNEFSVRTR